MCMWDWPVIALLFLYYDQWIWAYAIMVFVVVFGYGSALGTPPQ